MFAILTYYNVVRMQDEMKERKGGGDGGAYNGFLWKVDEVGELAGVMRWSAT